MAFVSLDKSLKRLSNLNIDPSLIEKQFLKEQDKIVIEFTKKLTEYPQIIVDEDVNKLRKFYTSKQIAEIIYLIAIFNMFDRFTESLAFKVSD